MYMKRTQVGVQPQSHLVNDGVDKDENKTPNNTAATVESYASAYATSVVWSSSAPIMKANERSLDFVFAVAYLNRVKSAFESKAGKYNEFLEVINGYQILKTSEALPPSTCVPMKGGDEMLKQVKKLFEGHYDLFEDFEEFILEHGPTLCRQNPKAGKGTKTSTFATQASQIPSLSPTSGPKPIECITKRHCISPSSSSFSLSTTNGEVHEPQATKCSSEVQTKKITEEEFLEKVRNFLTPCSEAYDAFILLINMYTKKKILGHECSQLIAPILAPAPELHTWFKKFVRRVDNKVSLSDTPTPAKEKLINNPTESETEECIMDIDYSSCQRYGVSYCIVPEQMQRASQDSFFNPSDPNSTLNNVYISIPNWPENIRCVPPRRTQLETCQNRIEDERFEMDMVIESNLRTIEYFQEVEKQMSLMSPEARENFMLDENLGGTPSFLNERSVRRIYGDGEMADDIIRGLKECPAVAIPRVLVQLQKKHMEWSYVCRDFQNHWRDELDFYKLKALEQKANQFKLTDMKSFKFKTLISEIVSVYNKKEEAKKSGSETMPADSFHLTLQYRNKLMIHDASELLLYCLRRLPSIELEDIKIINILMKQFIPDLLRHPHLEIVSDEDSGVEEVDSGHTSQWSQSKVVTSSLRKGGTQNRRALRRIRLAGENSTTVKCHEDVIESDEENCRMFIGNGSWYAFFRLYHIVCERLAQIYDLVPSLSEDDLLGGTVTGPLGYKLKLIEDPTECYLRVIDLIKDLINSKGDSKEYEERLREIFGTRAYIVFSMDKLLEAAVMQVLSLRDEDWPPFVDLYYKYNEKEPSRQKLKYEEEQNYVLEAKALISGKNSLYKLAVFHKNLTEMKVELIPLSAEAELDQNIRYNDRKKPEHFKLEESMTVPSGNSRHSIYFYRRGAMQKARKEHTKITLIKLKKFNRWHSRWLDRN